jgi:hypothetical protein
MIEDSQADELMVTTAIHDHEERKRSYARVARVLGVTVKPAGAAGAGASPRVA